MQDHTRKRQAEGVNITRVAVCALTVYIAAVFAIHWLMGDQLRFRQSRGNLAMPDAESVTVELTPGALVEQAFTAKIERLKTVSVQWSTFYRPNTGTVTMELRDLRDGTVLMAGSFDAAAITEGGVTELSAPAPLETVYGAPLLLRVWADCPAGSAVSPLMAASAAEDGFALTVNGVPAEGRLCFSAAGEDRIWTGMHYWALAACLGLLLALAAALVWRRWRAGRHSYVVSALYAVKKYKFLIQQLVARNFKVKYKRSILGAFWSFLNPLLMMSVQYIVFSTIFKNNIENFAVYLLIGIVLFNFFTEACGMSLTSVVDNSGLITKVYVPKYIYTLTRVMSSVVNLGISLIPLVLMALVTGVRFHRSAVLALYFLACLILFCLGMGLLLAASMVFFRDTQFLWGVLSMVWMYATPIFYPETILPEEFRFILQINPLYHFLRNTRMCILDGISPEPAAYVQCLLIAAVMLCAGSWVFYKTQDKFVLYL